MHFFKKSLKPPSLLSFNLLKGLGKPQTVFKKFPLISIRWSLSAPVAVNWEIGVNWGDGGKFNVEQRSYQGLFAWGG